MNVMNWIGRHRDESLAFAVSLGVHALLLMQTGFLARARVDPSAVPTDDRSRPVVATIAVVAIAATVEQPLAGAVSVSAEPARAPAVPARQMSSVASRPVPAARVAQAVAPSLDASVGFESADAAPREDEVEEVARSAALQRARAVNAAHIREREVRLRGEGDPVE